jgi:hypothetical protein
VHLTLRQGDDIRRVTKNFCKTYALNEGTRRKLESQIDEYLASMNQSHPISSSIASEYLKRDDQ